MSKKPVTNRKNFYENCEEKPVEDLVEEYLASGLDPYDTDIDMLHLRARLQNRIALEPLVNAIADFYLKQEQEICKQLKMKLDNGLTVEDVIRQKRKITKVKKGLRFLRTERKKLSKFSREIEVAHLKLVKAVQTRAETRALEQKAKEPGIFVELLQKLMTALREELPPESFRGLVRRMEQDLDRVPESLKTRKTSW